MHLDSFWPPRRTVDRLAAELYRRRNSDQPWLTRNAIGLLPDLLKTSDRVLEWGSGSSTAWLSRRVETVRSVEHDRQWYDRVRAELELAGMDGDAVRLLPTSPEDDPAASPYVRAVDEFADAELTVCLVDGEHRAACVREALRKLAVGGMLIVDDVQNYLDLATASPHSRHGLGPLNADWGTLHGELESWRLIHTSDGYSDTAFWIKP